MLLFESFKNIENICIEYGIRNYTINPDGTVDVDGDVDLYDEELTKIPLKFGRVTGYFNCGDNQLSTLEGCPEWVGGGFYCSKNQLSTLEGSPEWVGGDFYCEDNPVHNIFKLFPDYKSFQDSLDYGYLRGTDIVRSRFEEALEEIGKELPESIGGYKYI